MAEVVELRRERLLPEYEQMKKCDLFTDEEIRAVIKTREAFEYKISRQSKTIKDFIEYITYERNLKSKASERWKAMNTGSVCPVETSISHHIRNLYKQALGRFPEELRLWTNYLKFCKHANFLSECSSAFEKMLQYHGDKPDIWLKAAMWEYHEMNNFDRTKDLFLRGLQRHPKNPDMYTKFFNVMLNEASKMSADLVLEGNTQSEQSIGLQRAEVVYQSAKKKIHSCEFFVSLVDIATKFDFTKKLQKEILKYMMDTFCRDELLWHTLAQRELRGHNMVSLDEESNPLKKEGESMEVEVGPVKRTLRRKIELAVEVYSAAVRELKTEKMWSYYITAMIELNEDTSTQKEFKRTCLVNAFKGAYDADCLSEFHYLHFLEILLQSPNNDEFILQVLKKAVTKYPTCLKLWELWMRFYITKDDETKIREIFFKATKKLEADAHPLWRLMILYYQTCPDKSDRVDEIYQSAARQTSSVFDSYKSDYLEWVALSRSMVAARKVYNEMAKLPPPSLALHEKMAWLESVQIKPEIQCWRQCHEYATHYFGKIQTDVWINYIKFERDYGDPKNMNGIFERAKQSLSEELVDNFISEHNLLTTGVI